MGAARFRRRTAVAGVAAFAVTIAVFGGLAWGGAQAAGWLGKLLQGV